MEALAKTALPRVDLARFPTPIEAAPRLAAAIGAASLRIKREDLAGAAFGGNKLRQIELILGDAKAKGADMVISTAAAQSNFCRALSGSAAKIGLGCALLLRGKPGSPRIGNLLLDHVFGAEVTFTDLTDPWDPAIRAKLDEIADAARAKGRKPLIVQLTGDTAGLGVAAWAQGADEILEQGGDTATHMVVACGSSLTLAGLALGFKHRGLGPRLVGVSVQQPASRLRPWIVDVAARGAEVLGISTRLAENDFDMIEMTGPGYGVPSPESVAAVRLAGRTQGLVLDPVYSGKALAGLIAAVADGRIPKTADALFLHSGGAPGLFVHAGVFEGDA